MSRFLRDQYLKNLSITEEAITKINNELLEISKAHYNTLDPRIPDEEKRNFILLIVYTIRFDYKGYRLMDFNEIMHHFQQADTVERFIFSMASIRNRDTEYGEKIDLYFDSINMNNCFIRVQGEDKKWVDSTFLTLTETISRYKNRHGLIRNRFIPALLQTAGIISVFFISIWLSTLLSPHLEIDNSLTFSFIVIFILLFNAWTYVLQDLISLVNNYWPNVAFKKRTPHWLIQALIGAVLFGILGTLISFAWNRIAQFIK
jgi:hypothetical protein